MFIFTRRLVCLLVFYFLNCLSVFAQNEADIRTADWQGYLDSHTQWLTARQQHARLVAEDAAAKLDWQLQKSAAQRDLILHEYALEADLNGLREVRLTGLKNEIVILVEKLKQAQVRRDWSVKLANRGLISQKELEADEIAVERLSGQLQSKQDELHSEQEMSGMSTQAELVIARDRARSAMAKLESDGRMAESIRRKTIEHKQQEVNQLHLTLRQKQMDFERLRTLLAQQESTVGTDQHRREIQKLQEDMQANEEAEVQARSQRDKEVAHWHQRLAKVQQSLANFENKPSRKAPEIQILEAAVQSAQEKVNQSIQNESWASRVKKKGFITQVLYEKYSLALLEARLNLNYQQQKLQIESGLLTTHLNRLERFDLNAARQEVDTVKGVAACYESYSRFIAERHREQVSRQLAVLGVLKLIAQGSAD